MLNGAKLGSRLLLDCRAVTLPIGQRKTWRRQSQFLHLAKFRYGATAAQKCICSLAAQVRTKRCAKFGWIPLSDVAAVTKPRRESH